jgi:heme-degrading monooxygenase HmoA
MPWAHQSRRLSRDKPLTLFQKQHEISLHTHQQAGGIGAINVGVDEDHTLYASHTVWENRATFEAWTKSEAFRAAHHNAGDNKPLYLGHPEFEGFEVCQTVGRGKTAA